MKLKRKEYRKDIVIHDGVVDFNCPKCNHRQTQEWKGKNIYICEKCSNEIELIPAGGGYRKQEL